MKAELRPRTPRSRGKTSARDVLLNDFANRAFRDTADQDYILARAAARAHLWSQFQWMGLQAVEKYFKAILLYNRIPAKRVGHSLEKALKRAEDLPFEIRLTEPARKMIQHLDRYGRFRYLETSYHVNGPVLLELDRLVWEVRRYCKVLNYEVTMTDGSSVNLLEAELQSIEDAEKEPWHRYRIMGGFLEKVLSRPDHPARRDLLWQNLFFGVRDRTSVRMQVGMSATIAPLALRPQLLDEVLKFVFVPKEAVDAYRQQAASKG